MKWLTSLAPCKRVKTVQRTRQRGSPLRPRQSIILHKQRSENAAGYQKAPGEQQCETRARWGGPSHQKAHVPAAAWTLFPAFSDWTFPEQSHCVKSFTLMITMREKKAIFYHWWMSRLQKHICQYVSEALKKHIMFVWSDSTSRILIKDARKFTKIYVYKNASYHIIIGAKTWKIQKLNIQP